MFAQGAKILNLLTALTKVIRDKNTPNNVKKEYQMYIKSDFSYSVTVNRAKESLRIIEKNKISYFSSYELLHELFTKKGKNSQTRIYISIEMKDYYRKIIHNIQ